MGIQDHILDFKSPFWFMTSGTKRTPLFHQFGKKSSYLEILGLNHKGADSLFSGLRFELYLSRYSAHVFQIPFQKGFFV